MGLAMLRLSVLLVMTVTAKTSPFSCLNRTTSCPLTELAWKERQWEFNCSKSGYTYTCLLDEGNELIETCIIEYTINAGVGGCPYILDCTFEGDEAALPLNADFTACPEDIQGCPPKNHTGYTLHDIYKYPACLTVDRSPDNGISTTTYASLVPHSTLKSSTGLPVQETADVPMHLTIFLITVICILILGAIATMVIIWTLNQYRSKGRSDGAVSFSQTQQSCDEEQPLLNRPAENDVEKASSSNSEKQIGTDDDIKRLRQLLYDMISSQTLNVEVSPYLSSTKLPLEVFYVPPEIKDTADDQLIQSPHDLFYRDGERVQRIFLLGDAAHGKTLYCMRLARYWCTALNKVKNDNAAIQLQSYEEVMSTFDLIFLVQLRDVDKLMALDDIICLYLFRYYPEYHDVIRRVLSNYQYHCLIIVDGIDEFLHSENDIETSWCELSRNDNLSHNTVLFTFRFWTFCSIENTLLDTDRVVKLCTFNTERKDLLRYKILTNWRGVEMTSDKYKLKFDAMNEKINGASVEYLLDIPAFVVAFAIISAENKFESLTSFLKTVSAILLDRYFQGKSKFMHSLASPSLQPSRILEISRFKREQEHYAHDFPHLKGLCKIAFQNYHDNNAVVVFSKEMLTRSLTEEEISLCLNVGLLCQRQKLDINRTRKNAVFSFFHKGIHDFLTAVYIAKHDPKGNNIDNFCRYLSNISRIISMSKVIIFVSGLSYTKGTTILKHIETLCESDRDLYRYRTSHSADIKGKVKELFHMQMCCYREMYFSKLSPDSSTRKYFHIRDIFVDQDTDTDTIKETSDILTSCHTNLRSLCLVGVSNNTDSGITDDAISKFLEKAYSLTALRIEDRVLQDFRGNFSALTVLFLNSVSLSEIAVRNIEETLKESKQLEDITFWYIETDDRAFELNLALCRNLKKLSLNYIKVNVPAISPEKVEEITIGKTFEGLFCKMLKEMKTFSNLYSLKVHYMENSISRKTLLDVLPHLKQLSSFRYRGTYFTGADCEYDKEVVQNIPYLTGLKYLELRDVLLNGSSLTLPDRMKLLEKVELNRVKQTAIAWEKFLVSCFNIHRLVCVFIADGELNEELVTKMCECSDFNFKYHDPSTLSFIRVGS